MKKNPGYILVLTLMVIALAITLLTSVVRRSFVYQQRARFSADREQARTLALGGIQIALSQLSMVLPAEKKDADTKSETTTKPKAPDATQQQKKETEKKESKLTPEQDYLLQILPVINRWQTFALKEESDDIDASLELNISCEQGKINLNYLFAKPSDQNGAQAEQKPGEANQANQKKNGEKKPAEPEKAQSQNKTTFADVVQDRLEKKLKVSLLDALKSSKKKLSRSLEDPTELLLFDGTKAFAEAVFARPAQEKEESKIALMNLFTTLTKSGRINPWLLSESFCVLFGFTTPGARAKDFDYKKIVSQMSSFAFWPIDWDRTVGSLYGKKFASLPNELTSLFAAQFDATIFSVLSYANVGKVQQKVCAVVEKSQPADSISSKSVVFKIKKVYWL